MLFKSNNKPLKFNQHSKYIVNTLTLLFLSTVGYSGYVIYQNKHNHNGGSINLINLITRKESNVSKLKDSSLAVQNAEQNAQYNQKSITVKKATITENSKRLVAIDFFNDYVSNLASGQSEDLVISKYGTVNLAAQYKTLSSPKAVVCGGENLNNSTIKIDGQVDQGPNVTYSVNFLDANNQTLVEVQTGVVWQNGQYLVDSITCRGPE